ncbi:MAG TPA: TonB-dependent receptor plug domain-containing protein, partial [Chitinophagaceae bacterium]|nr:TonB-dependent receptor plug domain-containing protein [Chitinophagaceae bacterium]
SVTIKAFEQNRILRDVPAAINYIGKNTLERFSSTSIVSAINSTPGVRMEERSPGSYRMNIRGSSLRSPFGVRNVKIYYNDIPYTDPGGHSYFNQLGYYNFNSIEIIKGANNSLYGAGTGGVMLIESLNENGKEGIAAEYAAGSYGLQNMYGSLTTTSDKSISKVGFQHQQSNGYRDHSDLKRDVINWNGIFRLGENNFLKTSFLYGDLFYKTPGALTKAEFDANPKAARPGNQFFPGAIAANASIHQKMFLAGASYTQLITSNLQNKTTLYGVFSELRNPAISNYGKNSEPHAGGRTVFKYSVLVNNVMVTLDAGAEYQLGFASYSVHKNAGGNQDTLRTCDDINNRQQLLFAQASVNLRKWKIITGASWNTLRIKFQRFTPSTFGIQNRTFNNGIAPRLIVMRKLHSINIYAGIAKGFSPPTTAELLPTGGAINLGLNAEKGINYDVGLKGNFLKGIYIDINAFFFSLKNTIVLRRNAAGSDFYLNAGGTKQYGIETHINYPLSISKNIKSSLLWLSHTWHNFHYQDFKQLNTDFSGNRLPSVAQHSISSGIDLAMKNGLLATLNYYYSDKIALNDANSEYAKSYHLVGAKIGYERLIKNKLKFKIFLGAENILNQTYSLGNDINGFGGRYYNAAPTRNYYIKLALQLRGKKTFLPSIN